MSTLPAPMVAPRSPTNLPTNSISVSMSMAGVSVFSSTVVMSGSPLSGIPGGCRCGHAAPHPLQTGCNGAAMTVSEGGSMRAREPDEQGYVERDGVRIGYERFGDGGTTVVLPTYDTIVDARLWKGQV